MGADFWLSLIGLSVGRVLWAGIVASVAGVLTYRAIRNGGASWIILVVLGLLGCVVGIMLTVVTQMILNEQLGHQIADLEISGGLALWGAILGPFLGVWLAKTANKRAAASQASPPSPPRKTMRLRFAFASCAALIYLFAAYQYSENRAQTVDSSTKCSYLVKVANKTEKQYKNEMDTNKARAVYNEIFVQFGELILKQFYQRDSLYKSHFPEMWQQEKLILSVLSWCRSHTGTVQNAAAQVYDESTRETPEQLLQSIMGITPLAPGGPPRRKP